MKYNRIFLIVLDSLGIGGAKDAETFHDAGTNTLGHILEKTNIQLPNLEKLGFLNLVEKSNVKPIGYYCRGEEVSNGKDTLTGHLEMMGVITTKPFQTYTKNGFPLELIQKIEEFSGRKVIGNCDASGTEIIERLGKEQMETGALIVYTSADSVLQIAAHEEIIPLEELYRICEYAREITKEEKWKVGRIIARPYIGTPGNFTRTSNRHDYALNPASDTVLDYLKQNHYTVYTIGKISDIFNNCGVTKSIKTKDNLDGIHKIIDAEKEEFTGLCFANLNDFDSKYGHRRDVEGYGNAIVEFDQYLPQIMEQLKEDDLLIITADHGNDPTYIGTDHTRENIPVLIYAKGLKEPKQLENLTTFASIGATVMDNFKLEYQGIGQSFLNEIR